MKTAPSAARRQPWQKQVYDFLINTIISEGYQVGDYLPSVRSLAKQFSVSITPVHVAMTELEAAGYIERVHGSGAVLKRLPTVPGSPQSTVLPVVDVLGNSEDARAAAAGQPARPHRLETLMQSVVHHLGHQSDLRLSLSLVPARAKADASDGPEARLRLIMRSQPKVIVPLLRADGEGFAALLREVRAAGIAVVHYAARFEAKECDRVYSDYAQGQRDLTCYLLARGKKRILRIVTRADLPYELAKTRGFREVTSAAGLSEEACPEVVYSARAGGSAETKLLQLVEVLKAAGVPEGRFDAICAPSDEVVAFTRIALRLLQCSGIEVAGYDGFWTEVDWAAPDTLGQLAQNFAEELRPELRPVSVDAGLPAVGREIADVAKMRASEAAVGEAIVRTVPQVLLPPKG